MPSIPNPFALAAKAVRAFFKADVKLRRGRRGLEVVLDEGLAQAAAAAPSQPGSSRDQQDLRHMQASLRSLLDEQPGNRQALRHLAFVEHALDRGGLRALQKMPWDVMRRAHAQLEGLVSNWSDKGLATLRSKMAVALIEREPTGPDATRGAAGQPQADGDSTVDSTAPLAHPESLHGEEAAEAEAALLAAYGSMAFAGAAPQDAAAATPEPRERAVEAAH